MFVSIFKKFFYLYNFISIVRLHVAAAENEISLQRQNLILSLPKDLSIKNVVLFNPSSKIDDKIITFAKSLFESQIYFSFLSAQQVQSLLDDFYNSKRTFVKSLILTFKEEFNDEIFKLITKNERSSYKFLWWVWDNPSKIVSRYDFHVPYKKTLEQQMRFYIPYNTQLLIVEDKIDKDTNISIISEIYHPRILSPVMFTRHLGNWSENEGFKLSVMDMYQRRFDMNKTELLFLLQQQDIVPKHEKWIDFIRDIKAAMNFRFVQYINNTSTEQATGRWEIFLNPFLDFGKSQEMDNKLERLGFMQPAEISMYTRYNELIEIYEISLFIRPFSKELWQTILISILLVGACTILLVHAIKYTGQLSRFDFLSALLHPLEAFTNQFGSEDPEKNSIKLIIISTRLAALFIVPSYSAFILSFILNPNVKVPFTDIKGFVQDQTYKFGFDVFTYYDGMLNETNDPFLKKAYEDYSLKPYERPKTVEEMKKKLCISRKTTFLIARENILDIPCKFIKIPIPIFKGWTTLLLRPGSPFARILNRILRTYYSAGCWKRLDRGYYTALQLNKNFQTADADDAVKMKAVTPILQVLVIIYVMSVMILVFECFLKKFRSIQHVNFLDQMMKFLLLNKNLYRRPKG